VPACRHRQIGQAVTARRLSDAVAFDPGFPTTFLEENRRFVDGAAGERVSWPG
jgi:hypothetical protein